eukprot:SAG11_NODE_684_length_7743_cov_53.800628_6_plen_303_part_00
MTTQRPTTVLVHGLDSSRDTWAGVLAELAKNGYPALALDLRGHGESSLGDPVDFGPSALAADVVAAIAAHGITGPVVLVGHSMGGRIAMRMAACEAARLAQEPTAAPLLAACVVEDMDCCVRLASAPSPPDSALDTAQRASLEEWAAEGGRRFANWDRCREALLYWYGGDTRRVDGWRGNRVRPLPGDGGWWSDINPAAQRLARARVLSSADGWDAWRMLAAAGPALPFAVRLWIADAPGTVCAWDGDGGLHSMIRLLESAGGGRFEAKVFAGAGHSIHNTRRDEFVRELMAVVDAAAVGAR